MFLQERRNGNRAQGGNNINTEKAKQLPGRAVASTSTSTSNVGIIKREKLKIIDDIIKTKYNTNNNYYPNTINKLSKISKLINNNKNINYYLNKINMTNKTITNINSFKNAINKIANLYYKSEKMTTKNRSRILTRINNFTNSNFSNSNLNKNENLNLARKNLKEPPNKSINKNNNFVRNYYKKQIVRRKSEINNRNTLEFKMDDNDFVLFLVNVYKDMLHDKILPQTKKEDRINYFINKILPKFTNMNRNSNTINTSIKNLEAILKTVPLTIEPKTRENLNNIEKTILNNLPNNSKIKKIFKETLYQVKDIVVGSQREVKFKKGINIIYDSDSKNVIYNSVIKPNENVKILYTPISSLNKGANLLPTPFYAYRENKIRGNIKNKIFKIKPSSSTFIIKSKSDTFKTVIKTRYVNDKIVIYLNGNEVNITSRGSINNYSNVLSRLGKFLGDFIQILTCLLYTKNNKNNVCFATSDKHAASMFIFFGKFILNKFDKSYINMNNIDRGLATREKYKKRQEYFKKKLPKLIYLRQTGRLANVSQVRFHINFYNLNDFIKVSK